VALGCDWDWWHEPCANGHTHTVRVCVRCLTVDGAEPCPAADEPVTEVAA
jgi:hypothetical protein